MKKLFLCVLFSFSVFAVNAQGTWTKKADVNTCGGHTLWLSSGYVNIKDKCYIFGGGSPNSYSDQCVVYDPATDVWKIIANYPGGTTSESSAFVIGDSAYSCNGDNPTRHDWNWMYIPATDTWKQKANVPNGGRGYNYTFSINGKGYCGLGKDAPDNIVKDFYEYDPVADTWKKLTDFPGGGTFFGTYFTIGNKGYLGMGGTTKDWPHSLTNEWWEFDPSKPNPWKKLNNFPGTLRAAATGFSKCNYGYIIGGCDATQMFNDFWEYNPVNDKWTKLGNFPGSPRQYGSVGYGVKNKLYFGFGKDDFSNLSYGDMWEWKFFTDFKMSDTSICAGMNISLKDSSFNHAISWKWAFNGAVTTSSTMKNPSGIQYNTQGNYIITMITTDTCGYSDTVSKSIHVLPAMPVSAGTDTSICKGKSTTLSASGGTEYKWGPVNGLSCTDCQKPIASPTATTTYIVSVNSSTKCSNMDTIVVYVNPLPEVNLGNDTSFCFGKSIVLDAGNPGCNYKWTNGSTGKTYTADSMGLYFVEVTDSNGCKSTDSIQVTVYPQVKPVVNDTLICEGDTAFIMAHGGSKYVWNTGDTLQFIKVSPSAETLYTVTVFDSYGCSALADMRLAVGLLPVADFKAGDTSVFEFQDVKFTDMSTLATKWQWTFGDGMGTSDEQNPTYPYKKMGKYSVKLIVTSSDGCSDTLLKKEYITVKPTQLVFIPSSFTPNKDFKNDVLYVRGPIKSMDFKIYNQWGLLLFESTDKKTGWDGTWNGNDQPEGNYVYVLECVTMDDNQVNQQGVISLIR